MTGVVNATFDDKVQQNAITEAQRVGKEVNEKFKSMEREIKALSDNNVSLQKQLSDLQQTNSGLVQAMTSNKGESSQGNAGAGNAGKADAGDNASPLRRGAK